MRIETETITTTHDVKRYFADDGTEFATQKECENYETNKKEEEAYAKISHLRIPELDDVIPIHWDASFSEWMHYRWYKVNSDTDVSLLTEYYDTTLETPKEYPGYICIETETEDDRYGQPYDYSLDEAFNITRKFFNQFGYEVEFKKSDEVYSITDNNGNILEG